MKLLSHITAERMTQRLSMLERICSVLDPEEPPPRRPKRSRRLKRILEQTTALEEKAALLRAAELKPDLTRLTSLAERLSTLHERLENKVRISTDEAHRLASAVAAVRGEINRLARDPDVASVLTMEALASPDRPDLET